LLAEQGIRTSPASAREFPDRLLVYAGGRRPRAMELRALMSEKCQGWDPREIGAEPNLRHLGRDAITHGRDDGQIIELQRCPGEPLVEAHSEGRRQCLPKGLGHDLPTFRTSSP
jgi:hypothetical protein